MDYRYWDSNAFLGWLGDEADKVPHCRPVLEAAEAGKLVLVTSALTITEVLWLKGQPKLSAQHAKRVELFSVINGLLFGRSIVLSPRMLDD